MLTAIHTIICFVAIGLGIVAVPAMLHPGKPDRWGVPFLVAAVLATGTGFLFPFAGVTPAFATGIVSTLVLLAVVAARYGYHLAGRWRMVYAAGMVFSLYLLVFVLIAQAFQKLPALNALAPTGSEPAFAVAQAICLVVFLVIGYRAVRNARPRIVA